MVSSSDLKYKLMRRYFQPITFLDCSRTDFMYFYMKLKKNSVWYNFFSRHFSVYKLFIFLSIINSGWWIVKPKGFFFPKTPRLCVWHTEVRNCYHFKLVSNFQLWFPIWGVLANRLKQTDDIDDIKLLGTSWLVHVAYAASKLSALHLNGCLASTRVFRSTLSKFLWNPPPSPAPPV